MTQSVTELVSARQGSDDNLQQKIRQLQLEVDHVMEANGRISNAVPLAAINDRIFVLEQRDSSRSAAQQSSHAGPTRFISTEPIGYT